MVDASSAPLSAGPAAPASAGWAAPQYDSPTAPGPRRPRMVQVAAVVVAVILVVGVIVFLLPPAPGASVTVTGIAVSSPDDACGLNGATDDGFNATVGQSIQFTYDISGNSTISGGTAACTIESVSTTTPGFSVTGANVPLSIPANSIQQLSFTMNLPGSAYTGVLTLVIT